MHGLGNYKSPPPSEEEDDPDTTGESTVDPVSRISRTRRYICTREGLKGFLREKGTYDSCLPKHDMFAMCRNDTVIFCDKPLGTDTKGSVITITPDLRIVSRPRDTDPYIQYALVDKTGERTWLEIRDVAAAESLIPKGLEKCFVAEGDESLFCTDKGKEWTPPSDDPFPPVTSTLASQTPSGSAAS
jgi:hypothetical protein